MKRKKLILIIIVLLLIGGGVGTYLALQNDKTEDPEPVKPETTQPEPVKTIKITVMSADETMGTVKGGGVFYANDSLITIEAIANKGYQFVSWDDNNTEPQRQVVVEQDRVYLAEFGKKQPEPEPEPNPVGTPKPTPTPQTIKWNGVATYNGPTQSGQPNGIGGSLYFNKDFQLDLQDIKGTKLNISTGETIENTKFENGKLRQGELHRNDGTRKWFNI